MNHRRVDGGWYISMVRQLHVVLCTNTTLLSAPQRQAVSKACHACVQVQTSLRIPLKKAAIQAYQDDIDDLLDQVITICMPSTPSECQSIKYHWPRHWAITRREIGTAAMEKSLERKLGETHGRTNFVYTNSKGDKEVQASPPHDAPPTAHLPLHYLFALY